MKNKPETEVLREIWPNLHGPDEGYNYEVGPDRDGMCCVELRYKEGEKTKHRLAFPPEEAELIGQAILNCAKEMMEKKIL